MNTYTVAKAYFDLEAAPGVWSKEQGRGKCKVVIHEWEQRVQKRWLEVWKECPHCLAHMILNSIQMTDDGWKVSYHVVFKFPWFFSCNTTMQKNEAKALSAHPDFRYLSKDRV